MHHTGVYDLNAPGCQWLHRTGRNADACEGLVSAAVKVLPQAKKKQLQRLVKTQSIEAIKEQKRAARVSDAVDGEGIAWTDLAPELVEAVFDRLDPCSLGVSACVCTAWHNEARKEGRWMRMYEKACGITFREAIGQQLFREAVRDLVKGVSSASLMCSIHQHEEDATSIAKH